MISRREALGVLGATALTVSRPARASSQPLPVVRVGAQPDDDVTPVLYGIRSGIFERLGLSVKVQRAPGGAAIASAVAGGSIDIGHSNMLPLIIAHTRGLAFTIVAGAGLYLADHPDGALVVAADAPIRTASDLNGKIASVPSLRDIFQLAIMAWVDRQGGDSSTVKFIEVPNAVVPEALGQRRIDAAMLVNPSLIAALDTQKVRVLAHSFDALAERFLIAAWFCDETYAQRNHDLIRRFREGIRQAASYTNTHPQETVAVLASFSRIKADLIKRMQRNIAELSLNPKDIQPLIDASVKYKLIANGFPARELTAS